MIFDAKKRTSMNDYDDDDDDNDVDDIDEDNDVDDDGDNDDYDDHDNDGVDDNDQRSNCKMGLFIYPLQCVRTSLRSCLVFLTGAGLMENE